MKLIETILTPIFIILFFALIIFTQAYYERMAEIERKKQQELDAIAARTIITEVIHDSDPNTNTFPVTITTNCDDPDGDRFRYLWSQVSGPVISSVSSDTLPDISFDASPGRYKLALTLTDTYGAQCEEYVIVSVGEEPNRCPNPVINYYIAETPIITIDSTLAQ